MDMLFGKKKANDPGAGLEKAAGYSLKGDELTRRHEFAEAEKWYLKAIAVLEPLAEQGGSMKVMRELSRAYSMMSVLGRAVTDEKKRAEAAGWLKKSLLIDEKLAEADGSPQAWDDLACSYSGLGAMTLDAAYSEKALAIWNDLKRKHPENAAYAKRVADEEFNIKKIKELKG